jgi:hypothetical protein
LPLLNQAVTVGHSLSYTLPLQIDNEANAITLSTYETFQVVLPAFMTILSGVFMMAPTLAS